MNEKIEKLAEFVSKKFEEADMKFCGFAFYYPYHVYLSKEYGKKLAVKYNANPAVVELAMLLHDIGLIGKGREGHEQRSIELADKILREYGFSEDLIKHVKSCILHDSSTIEGKICDTSDALAHFNFSFIISKAKLYKNIEEFKEWLFKKLEKDYNRIQFPDEKKYAESKLNAIKTLIKDEISESTDNAND